ncbi:hypothetical protein PINS_up003063 [Pythium insidiosum]|nr:hypothetical protein PINS_up003063 [Pythium insidiosum]
MELAYRVRGRSSSVPSTSKTSSDNANNNHNSNQSKNEWRVDSAGSKQAMDPEKELELSRKAIEKQQKLQNWLIEKEKRELLRLQQEQDWMEEQRRLTAERDAKFFKHAQATKKKLQQLAAKQAQTGNDEVASNNSVSRLQQ